MSSEARTLTSDNVDELAAWCGGVPVVEHDALDHGVTYAALNVPTSNGVARAYEGQLIIRQHDGTFTIFKTL
jgi:hypothetical protein